MPGAPPAHVCRVAADHLVVSTDESGAPEVPHCGHCGTPFEPGHITCAQCGEARFLGGAIDGSAPPVPSAAPPTAASPDEGTEADSDPFGLGDPYRDVVRRRERGPAERSRTTLMIGGLIGLILVVLVAAAALWALGQHSSGTDF